MPNIFKALASISTWILFVFGCLSLLAGFGRLTMRPTVELISAYFGFGILALFLGVVTAKIRKNLE